MTKAIKLVTIAKHVKTQARSDFKIYHLDNDDILITDQSLKKKAEEKNEVCFICVESFIESSIPLCNHRICQKCSLRLRVLYNNMNCVYCKTFQPNVIFSKGLMNYNDFELEKLYSDRRFGIFFETQQIMENILSLLDFNCPKSDCNIVCYDWQDLKKHVKNLHGKYLWYSNKKVFAHEHILFSKYDLLVHIKKGDFGNKRNETGFKGHPECGFCKRSFYDDDDLYKHCRECHERCHICDQMAGQIKHQYYLNYDSLEKHFRKNHYICPETECLEKRFVVFGTEIDLKAHQLEVHKNNLSSKALKEAKRIPMSFVFDYPRTFKYSKGKNIIRTSSGLQDYDEHMTRAERALKRQEENMLQESRKIDVLLGDTILTDSHVQSVVVGSSNSRSAPNCIMPNSLKDEEFPGLNGKVSTKLKELSISNKNDLDTSFLCNSFFNYDSKIASQYSAILNNASNLLNNIEKIKQFWSSVLAFSNSTITAIEFVEVLWTLFNGRLEEMSKVLYQFTDLIHNDNKKSELLIAWNDWKIKNQAKNTFIKIIDCSHSNSLPSSLPDFSVNSSASLNQNNSKYFLGNSYAVDFPSLCSIEKKPSSSYFHIKNISNSQNVWNSLSKKNTIIEENISESKMKS
ncbi:hypothetical protein PCANB_001842 [Pneumocystis canis]|nr:hypothetical protein PCANB_001842 [Pneumocystis canis]